jgi:hypothetical protein
MLLHLRALLWLMRLQLPWLLLLLLWALLWLSPLL